MNRKKSLRAAVRSNCDQIGDIILGYTDELRLRRTHYFERNLSICSDYMSLLNTFKNLAVLGSVEPNQVRRGMRVNMLSSLYGGMRRLDAMSPRDQSANGDRAILLELAYV